MAKELNYSRRGSQKVYYIIKKHLTLNNHASFIDAYVAKIIITANTSPLSGRDLPLKQSLEVILDSPDSKIQHVLVYKRTDAVVPMEPGRDEWLEEVHNNIIMLLLLSVHMHL